MPSDEERFRQYVDASEQRVERIWRRRRGRGLIGLALMGMAAGAYAVGRQMLSDWNAQQRHAGRQKRRK